MRDLINKLYEENVEDKEDVSIEDFILTIDLDHLQYILNNKPEK